MSVGSTPTSGTTNHPRKSQEINELGRERPLAASLFALSDFKSISAILSKKLSNFCQFFIWGKLRGRKLLVYSVPSAVDIGVFSPGADEFDQWDWSAARHPISYWVGFFCRDNTYHFEIFFSSLSLRFIEKIRENFSLSH